MDSKDKDTKSLNPRAIYSKTGKGVQEASGKTSHLSRADRAVLAAIDGKTMLSEVQSKFEKLAPAKFDALIRQLDNDGFVREVSSGEPSIAPRAAAPAAKAAPKGSPKAAPPPTDEGSDGLDFTQLTPTIPKPSSAPKAPQVDLAAAARAEAERKAKEQQAVDFRARQEAEAKAKAEAEAKARAAAEARARAEAEAKARAEAEAKAVAEAKARAEAASRAQAEAEAKVKAAREAAVRLAAEAKAKAEADAKAKAEAAEKEKERLEAELTAKIEAERKAREEAERRAAEAAEQARKDLEEKAKRDAEEMRQRLEAEMQAKLEAERKAREEEDRKRREEEDRRRKEEDERRRKEDEERRAREEAERKAREEAERKRREEEERKRREEDERRRKEDEERRAREEAERKKREEEDRKRRDEDDRRRKEEDERRRKEDEERRARAEADAKARAAADAAASLPKIEAVAPPPPPAAAPPAASGGGIGDSLLADLDSFGKREEEEQKEREEAERKAKEESARREKAESERRAKEEADKKRREEEGRRRKEEDERRAREEEERREREEEERRKEEEEARKRKAKEEQAAKQAAERAEKAAAAKGATRKVAADEDDIPVTEEDLDTDDLKRDQKVAAEKARRAAREAPPVAVASGRPRKLGKPIAIALAVLLVVGIGVLNVMPVSTGDYEKAASEAMGAPVKIGSARLSVLTGVEVKMEGVTVGGAKIRGARGSLELGSLFGARKAFSRMELEGVQVDQSQLGDALLGKVAGANFRIGRIVAKQIVLEGPLKLPALDLDATVAGDGTLQSVKLTGGDKIVATLSPKGGEIGFEISAGSLEMPFVPALSLSEFAMKGSANRSGVVSSEFDGRVYDGVLSGSARVRWGDNWTVEGEVKARNLKVAVFAPTLVSDGRVDGRAAYSMSGSAPGSLYQSARMQGEFKIDKGVLGAFDVSRALQTGGAQSGGRTVFNEMSGQGLYDKGAMQFSNVVISAGALNAGASLHIDANGALSGRLVADVKTASQKQSATLNISGKVQEPVIRK